MLVFGALAALALSGCSTGPGGITPPQDSQGRYMISMTSDLEFDPPEARIPAGATVVWNNTASMPHDVAGYRGDPIENDFSDFSSSDQPPEGLGRLIGPGEEYAHTFTDKQTWTIWCHTHHEERMKGIIHVG